MVWVCWLLAGVGGAPCGEGRGGLRGGGGGRRVRAEAGRRRPEAHAGWRRGAPARPCREGHRAGARGTAQAQAPACPRVGSEGCGSSETARARAGAGSAPIAAAAAAAAAGSSVASPRPTLDGIIDELAKP